MNDISRLELVGKEKEGAVNKCRKIVNSWGLTLPEVYACPFHFGLKDFYRIGEIEFDINNNIKEGYCGKFIFIFKDQICPMHYHKIKHETFYVVKGKVEMEANDKICILKQGDIFIMDQNIKHRFTGLEDSLILESSKPDIIEDSIFDDEKINKIIKENS